MSSGMPLEHLSPQLALVVGAAVVLVVVLFVSRERQWWGAPLALVALTASFLMQLDLTVDPDQRLTLEMLWALDDVTGMATLVILASTAIVVGLVPRWFATDVRHGEVYPLLLLAALGATVLAAAADLNELVVGVTLTSVTGYVLAAYHRADDRSVEAGIKYFLIGGLANLVLLIGVVLLFAAAGTTLYADLGTGLLDDGAALLLPAAALVVVGLGFKVGAVPTHGWMPDVAEGAPVPSAAFLTIVPKVGGFVALARVMQLLPEHASGWRPLVAVLAVLTMTVGNLAALNQEDVRRMLGWSSVSQSGYAMMAVAAIGRSDHAVPSLLLFLAAYAAGNLTCFGVVAALRGRTSFDDWSGLAGRRPLLAGAMVVGMLSLVGIPPLAGFAGKLALFTATLDAGLAWVAVAAALNTVVSLAYYVRLVGVMVRGEEVGDVALLGRASLVVVAVSTVAVVGLGFGANLVLGPSADALLLP